MIYILFLFIIIIILIIANKKQKENFNILSSEVYNNIQNICNPNTTSYFASLNINETSKINNKNLNKYIYDIIYPIGSFYVQLPDKNTNNILELFPNSKSPNMLFPGTTWTLMWNTGSQAGIFFRTEGALSDEIRIAGFQDFALKKIYGTMSWVQANRYNAGDGNTGVFSTKPNTKDIRTDSLNSDDDGHRNLFDTRLVLPNNTSETEVRVKNRLVRIWKRTS
jgi:hypothetical protein